MRNNFLCVQFGTSNASRESGAQVRYVAGLTRFAGKEETVLIFSGAALVSDNLSIS
jgi:hypothetical protein